MITAKKEIFSVSISPSTIPNSTVIQNRKKLKEDLRRMAQVADENDILITGDAFFLIIDEIGMGKIVIGDFGGIIADYGRSLSRMEGLDNTRQTVNQFWNIVNAHFTGESHFPINDPLYPETT